MRPQNSCKCAQGSDLSMACFWHRRGLHRAMCTWYGLSAQCTGAAQNGHGVVTTGSAGGSSPGTSQLPAAMAPAAEAGCCCATACLTISARWAASVASSCCRCTSARFCTSASTPSAVMGTTRGTLATAAPAEPKRPAWDVGADADAEEEKPTWPLCRWYLRGGTTVHPRGAHKEQTHRHRHKPRVEPKLPVSQQRKCKCRTLHRLFALDHVKVQFTWLVLRHATAAAQIVRTQPVDHTHHRRPRNVNAQAQKTITGIRSDRQNKTNYTPIGTGGEALNTILCEFTGVGNVNGRNELQCRRLRHREVIFSFVAAGSCTYYTMAQSRPGARPLHQI